MHLVHRFAPHFFPNLSTSTSLARPAPRPADAGADIAETDKPGDRPRGCGWFDSSHDLQAGLSITEHDGPDAVANELPLDIWLTWHLAGSTRPVAAVCA